jgi:ankyrin repeat protein
MASILPPELSLPAGDYYSQYPSPPVPDCLGRFAKISDFSPEWDYLSGGGKILIMGPDFHSGLNYYVMFDHVEVPAELIQDGVLRCHAPPQMKPGYVNFCVTRGNFVVFSEMCHFEYRSRDTQDDLMNINERNFKLRIVERLERLEREVNSITENPNLLTDCSMENMTQSIEEKGFSEEQLEGTFVKILNNLIGAIESKDTLNSQDRDGCTLLHYACALRYHFLAATLISHGVNVNIQDLNGNTPFHWAMKNSDQHMIKILVELVDMHKAEVCVSFDSITEERGAASPAMLYKNSPSIDSMISDLDDLGIESSSETSSPVLRTFKNRNFSEPPRPSSPLTPNRMVRRSIRQREDTEDGSASPSQVALRNYRERRKELVEDESKRRAARARVTVINEKRK